PEAEEGRGRLLDHAAQGEPDRLREFRGQRRRRQRAAAPPRRQAASVALAARPVRLDRAEEYRHRARPHPARLRVLPARPGQAGGRPAAPRRRPGGELGSAHRGGAAGDAAPRRGRRLRQAEGGEPRQAPRPQAARRVRQVAADPGRGEEAAARADTREIHRPGGGAGEEGMRFCFFAVFLFCSTTEAQEIVTVGSRPGVTQSFFIAGMGERKAEALALLYIGGGGSIRLRMEDGRPKFGANNFLPRSRAEFIRNGVLPVVMDAPSDQPGGLTDYYRSSDQQAVDARAVLAELKKRFPGLPVFLVGTSKGTVTAAYVGRALGSEVAGVVLTSSLFTPPRGSTLAGFDYASIKVPLLLVHHREDACES